MAVGDVRESSVLEVQLDALLSQECSIAARERRSPEASSPPAATGGVAAAELCRPHRPRRALADAASAFASSHPDKLAPVGKQKASSVAALTDLGLEEWAALAVAALTDLGFEESAALAALAAKGGDVQAAAAMLMDGAFRGGVSEVAPADALRVPIWADWLDGPFPAFELYSGEGGIPTFADVAAKGGAPVPCISPGDMLVAIDGDPAAKDVMRAARQLQRSRGAHVNAGLETRLTIRSPSGAEWSLATGSGDQSGKLVSVHTIKKASASDVCGVILQDHGASVIISEVRPGGLAAQAGLAAGMAIVSIGGTAIVPPSNKRRGATGNLHATALLRSLEGAVEVKGDLSVWSR